MGLHSVPNLVVTVVVVMVVFICGARSGTTHSWYPANVSVSRLASAATNATFRLSTEELCAAAADQREWPFLYTYENDNCTVYDVRIRGFEDESSQGATTACRTRLPKVCFEPFTSVEDLGCVYLHHTPMGWTDARVYCSRLGADLAYPNSFTGLQKYLMSNTSQVVWVGVKYRMWLNGSGAYIWATGMANTTDEPNGEMALCGRLEFINNAYLLFDDDCSLPYIFICRHSDG